MNRNFFRACTTIGALALLAACGDNPTSAPTLSPSDKPALGLTDPLNQSDGVCLARDAYLSGAVNGVNDDQDLADPEKSCTANDITIATADILEYSLDGVTYLPYTPGAIACDEGSDIFVKLNAHVKENAESERTDIGVWIATDGGNARTGTCNQYNLIAPAYDPTKPYTTVDGVANIDDDSCGDMVDQQEAIVELGIITAKCESVGTSTKVHVGSCVSWTQPGGDQVCPQGGSQTANGYRFGTVPGTTSKCNCEGFDIDITVNKTAKLEIVKACTPTNDNGTFDLLIDGSNANANDVACGGTTGVQTVTAGTNVLPGAVHTFGEGDFTTANYTSEYSCVNRDTENGPQHVFTASGDAAATGTSLGPNQITMMPDEDVVCTYTNVRKASLTIVKETAPASDPQDFAFTTTGTGLSNFTLDTDAGDGTYSNTTTFNNLTPGSGYVVTESAVSGWDLTNIACSAGGVADLANSKATITLAAGANVTCTFTNTKEGSITIEKVTVPSSHAQDFAFTTTGTGLSSFTLDTDAGNADFPSSKTFTGLSPDTYTVTETGVTGWDLTDVTCTTGGSDVGAVATIVLPAGGSVTCTYTNTQRASLTLNKVENGGLPLSRAWEFQLRTGTSTTQAGSLVATASANVTTGVITFPGTFAPGAYNLCEVGMPVDWTNNFDGYTPLGATQEGGDNATECIDITLVSGANGPGGITGVPNPIDNINNPPTGAARTIGYWKNWSSCTGGKQYIKAQQRGELFTTLDFYLPTGLTNSIYPFGDIVGPLSCAQAVNLLSKSNMNTGKKMASDPAYNLAAQLLAAKLNLAATGACADAIAAINAAQQLLADINFTGTGSYKSTMTAQQISSANTLAGTLDDFNNNELCTTP